MGSVAEKEKEFRLSVKVSEMRIRANGLQIFKAGLHVPEKAYLFQYTVLGDTSGWIKPLVDLDVGCYSSGSAAAKTVRTKLTGGFNLPCVSLCIFFTDPNVVFPSLIDV